MQKIYLGPSVKNFKNFDLKNRRVYSDEPTKIITELEKVAKLSGKLFVDVDKFIEAEAELKNPASPISLAYKNLQSAISK